MTLLFIHGYNDDGHHYPAWEKIFAQPKPEMFYWKSGRPLKDWFSAILSMKISSYGYAYDVLAIEAADSLYTDVSHSRGKYDVVCHSLGSRVVLSVMDTLPNCFGRVIFLNGAEGVKTATPIIQKNDRTDILNVAVRTDDVLHKLGRWRANGGCIGQAGLTMNAKNLTQVFLDGKEDQARMKARHGWNINGDNPDKTGDHSYSFLNPDNHALLKHFMDHGEI